MIFDALVGGYLRAAPMRSLASLSAIVVAVITAIITGLLGATAAQSLAGAVFLTNDDVTITLTGNIDERVLGRILRVEGIRSARPVIEGTLTGPHGARLDTMGVDMLAPLPQHVSIDADLPGPYLASGVGVDARRLRDGGAVIMPELARASGIGLGSLLHALAGTRRVDLRVAGIANRRAPAVADSVVFVDLSTAQEIFGRNGRFDRIDVVSFPTQTRAVVARLRRLALVNIAVEPTGQADPRTRSLVETFAVNTLALSAIALLMSAIVLANGIAASVASRRSQIGMLRAVGARRSQIFFAFVAEGVVYGAVGTLVGVMFAIVATHEAALAVLHADRVSYDAGIITRAAVATFVLSIAAAIFPARAAARIPPAQSASGASVTQPRAAGSGTLAGIACVTLACAAAGLVAVRHGAPAIARGAAALCLLSGVGACVPIALSAAAAACRSMPLMLRLAAAQLAARRGRSAVAVAALTIATGLIVATAALSTSYHAAIVRWSIDAGGRRFAEAFEPFLALMRGASLSIAGIAAVTVAGVLLALVLERKHDIITLRTIGISRGELRMMIALEAMIIAVCACILGCMLGLGLAVLMLQGIVTLNVPYGAMGNAFLIVLVSAGAAAIYPAHVAMRMRTDAVV